MTCPEGCKCDSCVDALIRLDHQVLVEENERRKKQHREAARRYYQQHKAEVLWHLNNKYKNDPEFREQVKRKNLERYHGKRVMMVGSAAVMVNE